MGCFCSNALQVTFEDKVSKKAYLKACKWLAQNIYSNVELSKHIMISIDKDDTKQLPAFTVNVFVKSDEKEERKSHCQACKHLHTVFYSIDKIDCSQCKVAAYYKRLDASVEGKIKFVQDIFLEEE